MIDDAAAQAFVERNRSAAMTTLRADGTPHTVRVGIAVVDGKIWSSSTQARARTRHLRLDPRSTLFVFDSAWAYLTLECRVTLLEGSDVPEQSVGLFQVMQQGISPAPGPGKLLWNGAAKTLEEFKQAMRDEKRLIYEFDVVRSYGMYGES
ncbi:MAG: pyridoxamine 5'-phosphate oxidase family protein [Dehalococcoidia bacterium]